MKKTFLYIAALTLAVGCNDYMDEDMGVFDSNFSAETVFVNLNLSIEEGVSDTRVSVTPGDTDTDPWETEWEDGDVIYVYSIDQEAYKTLTYVAEGNLGGTFSGDVYTGKNRIYSKSTSTTYDDNYTRLTRLYANANFTDGGTPLMISSEVINIDATDGDDSSTTNETIDVDMQLLSTAIDFRMTFTDIPDDIVDLTLTSIVLGSEEDGYISIPYSMASYPDKDIDSDDFYCYSAFDNSTVYTGRTLSTDIALENDTEYSVKFEAYPFDLAAGEKLLVTFTFNDGLLSKSFDFTNNSGANFEFARATHNYLEKSYDLSGILDEIFTDTWAADAVVFADTTSTGTEADPIEIASEEELAYLAKISTGFYEGLSSEGLYYKLTADLDLAGKLWYPIGSISTYFGGNFDGGNHTISNLTISGEDSYQGLFGCVQGYVSIEDNIVVPVSISNLNIKDPNVSSNSTFTGVLCGRISYGSISNCSVEGGSVTGASAYVGGICSHMLYVSISDCSVKDCSVTGSLSYVGGLCGYLNYSSISNCSVESGSVTGSTYVGGVVGRFTYSDMTKCYNEGATVYGYSTVGGLVGYAYGSSSTVGSISECYNRGDVVASVDYSSSTSATSTLRTGGVAGYTYYTNITSCYNSGDISGDYIMGGVVGQCATSSTLVACYNVGNVAEGSYLSPVFGYACGNVVGLFNTSSSSMTACYGASLSAYMIGYYTTDATASNCYCLYPTELVNEDYSASFDATGFNSAQLTSVADLNAKVGDMNTAANTALETTGVVYFTAGSDDNTLPSLMGETFEYVVPDVVEKPDDNIDDFTPNPDGGITDNGTTNTAL